jgi:hypothetical protein
MACVRKAAEYIRITTVLRSSLAKETIELVVTSNKLIIKFRGLATKGHVPRVWPAGHQLDHVSVEYTRDKKVVQEIV